MEFIFVVGTIGSGKSTYIKETFSPEEYEIIEVDDILKMINKECGYPEYSILRLKDALNYVLMRLNRCFKEKRNCINAGTLRGFKGTVNKFTNAKRHGFKTKLIHIDVSDEIAIKQNFERKSITGQGVDLENREKIIIINKELKEKIEKLKEMSIIDEFEVITKR